MAARRDHAVCMRRLRRRVTVTAAVVFLLLWTSFLVTALTGAGCRSATRDEDQRLRLCTVSIALRPFSPARFEPHKTAATDLERALIRAHRGDLSGARTDMQRALDAASFGDPARALADLRRHNAAATRAAAPPASALPAYSPSAAAHPSSAHPSSAPHSSAPPASSHPSSAPHSSAPPAAAPDTRPPPQLSFLAALQARIDSPRTPAEGRALWEDITTP